MDIERGDSLVQSEGSMPGAMASATRTKKNSWSFQIVCPFRKLKYLARREKFVHVPYQRGNKFRRRSMKKLVWQNIVAAIMTLTFE